MEFSDKDQKMISWLKRQDENWKTTRVIILVSSLFLLGLSVWLWVGGENAWHYLPIFGFSGYGLSYVLGSWSGRPEISLLLKLVERENEK